MGCLICVRPTKVWPNRVVSSNCPKFQIDEVWTSELSRHTYLFVYPRYLTLNYILKMSTLPQQYKWSGKSFSSCSWNFFFFLVIPCNSFCFDIKTHIQTKCYGDWDLLLQSTCCAARFVFCIYPQTFLTAIALWSLRSSNFSSHFVYLIMELSPQMLLHLALQA